MTSASLVSQATTIIQPTSTHNNVSITQNEHYKFFHHTPNDDNFYHVTCRIILNGSVPSDDCQYNYDYGFFYEYLATNYYIMCKFFPHSSIVNTLNREIYEIYGMDELDMDSNHMNGKYS